MKQPRKNKQWAREAAHALESAWKLAKLEYGRLDRTAKERLYKYGPMLCAEIRGIRDKERIKEFTRYAVRERLNDFHVDPASMDNYAINFLLAYLDSHVALDILTEHRVHAIMEYVIEKRA